MNKKITTILLLCSGLFPLTGKTATVFSDNFDYTGWSSGDNPMNAVWSGGAANAILPADESLPQLVRLNNNYVYIDFGHELTTDFSVSVKMMITNYSRQGWIGMTNADGSAGYAFQWVTALVGQYRGQGFMRIGKFALSESGAISWDITNTPAMNWERLSLKDLLSPHNSTLENPAITPPMADVVFAWDAETHTLSVTVDGTLVDSVQDISLNSFSRLYLAGGTYTEYADLSINSSTIPETSSTATLSLILVFTATWFGYRRLR